VGYDPGSDNDDDYGGYGESVGSSMSDTSSSHEGELGAIGSSASGQGYDDSAFSDYSMLSDSMQMADQLGGTIGQGMSQQEFNALTGRTATNPHPDSIFSQMFGRHNVDYTAQYGGAQGIAQLNAIQKDVYNNPIDSKGNLRGSAQDKTAFGNRVTIDRKQTGPEMVARGLASLTPLGMPLSFMGKTQQAIAPVAGVQVPGGVQGQGFNYNPTLDPSNPNYTGGTGMFGGIFDALTGGAGTQAYGQTKDALTSFFEKEDRAKENIDKGSGQFKGIGTIDKEVTNNAINNVVASNMPVNTQAMYNVLSRDPSKLDAFEFMARRPNMSYYPGAKGALDIYNKSRI
tara:strand:+ start:32 stop:1060 length:1029 start_codon:yes stop_codon:yes gene_type:complete